MHKESLRTWVRRAKADAAGSTPSTLGSAERERLKELEREVHKKNRNHGGYFVPRSR